VCVCRAEFKVSPPSYFLSPIGLWRRSRYFSLSSTPRVARYFGYGAAKFRGQRARSSRWYIVIRKPGIQRARWRLNGVKVSRVGNRAGTLGAVSREEDRTWSGWGSGDGKDAPSNSKLRPLSSLPASTPIYENPKHSDSRFRLCFLTMKHTRMMLSPHLERDLIYIIEES